jgi:hypothetical protein
MLFAKIIPGLDGDCSYSLPHAQIKKSAREVTALDSEKIHFFFAA